MVVEIGYPTGRESSCKHCGEALHQTEWAWGMTWSHEDGNPYCADAPQAEPTDDPPADDTRSTAQQRTVDEAGG